MGTTNALMLIAAGLVMAAFTAAAQNPRKKELETVPYVDIERYMGKWYEIALLPQRFERGCNCSTAEYTLNKKKGYVTVENRCRKDSMNGPLKSVKGKAFVTDKKTNAKLRVQFFWPFRADYWIIDLADDYDYAVVGHPNRKYLWILSRTPVMDEAVYQKLVQRAAAKGFDTSKLIRTVQDCNK